MKRVSLTRRPALCRSANRYLRQLRLLHPDKPLAVLRSQAMRETWDSQRSWKAAGGDIRTSLRLRAIRRGKADMRPKEREQGDLSALLDFSIL